MAQLIYRYSTMGAGKSLDLMKVADNYESGGRKVIIFTSALDYRFKVGYISSRIGINRPAISIHKDQSLLSLIKNHISDDTSCILIDEAQFLTSNQVVDLSLIVDNYDIPIIAYGLKNDFQNKLFEGSNALLCYADKIEELKTICKLCSEPRKEKKATMVLRIENYEPMRSGSQVKIGGDVQEGCGYIPVCRKCHRNPDKNKIKNIM